MMANKSFNPIKHSTIISLSTILILLLLLPISTTAVKLYPAKRSYDTHTYYVLHLTPSSTRDPIEIAKILGAEHVEKVGELSSHYLIRAPSDLVMKGIQDKLISDQIPIEGLTKKSDSHLEKREIFEIERDSVMERYAVLRRDGGDCDRINTLAKRDGGGGISEGIKSLGIRSLERQVPRMRIKRDLPVLSPIESNREDSFLIHSMKDELLNQLDSRSPIPEPQTPATIPLTAEPAGIVRDAIDQFGILDPIFPLQWHILNKVMQENSVNVTGVWANGVFGKGINVAIVDDGLDMFSRDLAPNYFAEGSWDYNDNNPTPKPRLSDDQHGTRCAGEISAAKNDVCGVGIAYEAGIAGIRILSASISDADEAAALNYGFQSNHIYSCSWGPPDDGKSMEAPGRLIKQAMLNGVQNGRGGKGSIYVFASGNGGSVDDQCNFDGYTNSLMSITVGAIDRKGLHPFYSEACAAIMVVTYSSGSGDNIHTTDVGENSCTDRHGGTSAAAPIAAGIFALVLETRPELTWRDLQHLCVQTAVQVNPGDPDWQMTASGRNFNHKYGFGKLDAWAIVEAAKTHKLVKPQAWWISEVSVVNETLTVEGASSIIKVSKNDLTNSNFEELEHVTVTVHIEHEKRGDVEVELLSPKGMISILARPRRFDLATTGLPGWMFMTVKHWDEDPVGEWKLRVRDRQSDDKVGKLINWSMTLYGSSIDASKAKLWQLPQEVYGDDEEEETTPVPTPIIDQTPTKIISATDAMKSYVKPTVHLPDDHAEAPGESHLPFETPLATLTPPTLDINPGGDIGNDHIPSHPGESKLPDDIQDLPVNSSPEFNEEDEDDFDTFNDESGGYLAGMKGLLLNSTWLFVAAGTVIIFAGGATAFFWMRKRKMSRLARGDGYDFAPMNDEEDISMRDLERRGGSGGGTSGGGGGPRTKDLYDAFALGDEELSEEDYDDEEVEEKSRKEEDQNVPYSDEAREKFLDEEGLPDREEDLNPPFKD